MQDSLVETILKQPEKALVILHEFAGFTEHSTDADSLLEMLPALFRLAGEEPLANLAEGYHLICRKSSDPELMSAGLHHLCKGIRECAPQDLIAGSEAALLFAFCQQALHVKDLRTIAELISDVNPLPYPDTDTAFHKFGHVLSKLTAHGDSLPAFFQVEDVADQLAYLQTYDEHLEQVSEDSHHLEGADRAIVERITQIWRGIISKEMSDLQSRAQLVLQLVTRRIWDGSATTLILRLSNEGRGPAMNIRVRMDDSDDYKGLDATLAVENLNMRDQADIELHLRPHPRDSRTRFRIQLTAQFDDLIGTDRVIHLSDTVYLLRPPEAFQMIPNPYVAGTPLQTGSPLFFGREDIFSFVNENLAAAQRNTLVLIGQRRTGKSSLLKQLPIRLSEDYLPVYIDGQSVALDPGLPAFFFSIAAEITYALVDRGLSITVPGIQDFTATPAHFFEREFLAKVQQLIGRRHLLLLLDEFEELEAAVSRGNLDASIFGFLRHLIQHGSSLSMIFCGTHHLEELENDYWGVLFNISLYKHVGPLSYSDAVHLIRDPVADYGMYYDDLALEKIWRVAGGHPYFLQLLCHSLVNGHNRSGRSNVTVEDVTRALDDILLYGEAHFVYLWSEASVEERQVLMALSHMLPMSGKATAAQVTDFLWTHQIPIPGGVVSTVLKQLAFRDILSVHSRGGVEAIPTYRWQLSVLGLWIQTYRRFSDLTGGGGL